MDEVLNLKKKALFVLGNTYEDLDEDDFEEDEDMDDLDFEYEEE